MTIYEKPDYSTGVWASNGTITNPTSDKIEQGHVVEKPKYEIVNFIENRQDQAIAYLMQKGVPEWDSGTEYPINAYIDYNGIVYRSKSQNIDEQPDINTGIWEVAFAANQNYVDLSEIVNRIINEEGYLELYVSKASPVVEGKVDGNGYLAAVGSVSTGTENVGYSFKGKTTDGICHNGSNIVVVNDSEEVAKFTEKPNVSDSSNTVATTQWVQDVINNTLNTLIPIGAIIEYTTEVVPNDLFMYAHGQAISRTTYATLFSVIGTRYGGGDGSTTFNLPDKRGLFTREWDNGKGIDAGRTLGTTQQDSVEKHKHIQSLGEAYDTAGIFGKSTTKGYQGSQGGLDNDNYLWYTNDGGVYQGTDPNAENPNVMGDETRPKNIAMVSLIRVK